jgi:hypothetical protein
VHRRGARKGARALYSPECVEEGFSEVREPPGQRLRPEWPDPVDWSTPNESGGWARQDPVLVPGVRRCGDYPVEGVSAGAGR